MGCRRSFLALFLGLTLGLVDFAACGVPRIRFKDVSRSKGIQSLAENHRRVPKWSKYDGATIADLDGDGWYDMVLSNHGNNAEWYWGTANGSFKSVDPRMKFFDVHGTAAADIDNDGKMEVIMTIGGSGGSRPSTPVLFSFNDSRKLKKSRGEKYRLGKERMRGRVASFVDVDNDGDLDLIYTNKREPGKRKAHLVYENSGNGRFVLKKDTGIESVDAYTIELFDINEDGNMDIIFFSRYGAAHLYLGTGDFKYVEDKDTLPLDLLSYAHSVAVMDYDNDGDLDLLILRGRRSPRGKLDSILLENTGKGRFVSVGQDKRLSTLTEYRPYHVTYGDFNNDGYIDLYITISTDYAAPRQDDLLMVNKKGLQFKLVEDHGIRTRGLPEDGNSAFAFDFNMDGNLDLLTGNRNSTWRLYENKSYLGNRHHLFVRVGRPPATELDPGLDRNPLGAVVKVFTREGGVFTRQVATPGRSHAQAYMDTLHFGLGKHKKIHRIVVEYTGGITLVRQHRINVDGEVIVGQFFRCGPGLTGKKCNRKPSCSIKNRCNGRGCERIFYTKCKTCRNYFCLAAGEESGPN
ncbi:hypothetical protein NDN08_007107 [Rhodosorus marinus]|uniref:ASPIC/UnbV domain-containing protein n=1 Tax=Rhodosorus marinus TaxID=101924 RepID=A0AAV8UIA1_9RHOD|nr:hypothetical protein NDN08_007107 [Rhodosorus marinus]